ncbi:MAG: PKD domain-containing protein [Cyclobacteriaceae bacterium]
MKTKTQVTRQAAISKFIQLISAVIAILVLASCSEGEPEPLPTASFSLSTYQAKVGEVITFENTSIDAKTYFWEFGDGQTSSEKEPSYAYSVAGNYEISLNVSNESGAHKTVAKVEIVDEVIPPSDSVYVTPPEGYLTTFSFDKVVVGSPTVYGQDEQNNTFTIYEPKGAEFTKPLVLLSPGGAWRRFTREEELIEVCKALALKGYAVGLLHYSLLESGENPGVDIQVKSVIDQRNAIRYFKTNAEQHKIDPDNIFIGGWSTGSMISLFNAVLQDDDVALIQGESLRNEISESLKKYESHNLYTDQSYEVQGALMMFGWLFDLNVLQSTDAPLMLINHKDAVMGDGVTSTWGNFKFLEEDYYGFDMIRSKALELGYIEGENLEYIKMEGAITMSNFASVEAMSLSNVDKISQFFYNNLKE